jgi:glycosyltransferase involved in cell wall biosynthesis
MHVALFSPSWPVAIHPNGIVTYVGWMTDELRSRGHRVSIFTGRLHAADQDAYEVVPSRTRRTGAWVRSKLLRSYFPVFEFGRSIADAVRKVDGVHKVDVLEIEESFGWSRAVERGTGVPTVVKLHGPAFMSLVEEELNSPFAEMKIAKEGAALRAARVVTSPSRTTLARTVERYGLAPRIARHVVNPLALPASAPIWSLDGCDRGSLLFVGRFDKRKGGDIMLLAFAQLLKQNPELTLTFVGPDQGIYDADGRKAHFEEWRRAHFPGAASDRVVFRGSLPPDQIYALRARSFITVIASRWENQSYTALEAMLQGCPVVSSDAGGQSESIEDGVSGLLAKAGDADDLSRRIKSLLDDPRRAQMLGQAARRYVQMHHSAPTVVSQTLQVYESAIETWKRTPK